MSLLNAITGHDRPKNILLGSIGTARVATTYLFTGESGIGKRLAAVEFAGAINCLNPVRVSRNPQSATSNRHPEYMDACDSCSSCRKFSSLIHPDLKVVEADNGLIKIDIIREVQEFLSFTPYEGRKKVVIIDGAECMNQPASNAFLRTLEEPPPDSVIILITMAPDRLLDTIRSRCFVVRFSPLSIDACREVIGRKVSGLDTETLESLAAFSMGRPGVAIQGEGAMARDAVSSMVRDIVGGGLSFQWRDRSDMDQWLNLFLMVLRDIIVMKISPDNRELLINRWLEGEISAISRSMELEEILRLYSEITLLTAHFRFNLNTSIVSNYIKSMFVNRVT